MALKRQNDTIKAQMAYRAVKHICAAVEARIDVHGSDGLADYCAQFAGTANTAKTAILGLVLRQLGREVRDEVREVLPLC